MRQHSCMVAAVKQREKNGAAPPHGSIWGTRKEGGQRGDWAARRKLEHACCEATGPSPPCHSVPGPRRDPDCLLAQRGLKRLRSVLAGKERGNECFSRGSFQEAYDHYSASLEADPQLCTPFMAQVPLLRLAGVALWQHAQSANHKRAMMVHKCCMHPRQQPPAAGGVQSCGSSSQAGAARRCSSGCRAGHPARCLVCQGVRAACSGGLPRCL